MVALFDIMEKKKDGTTFTYKKIKNNEKLQNKIKNIEKNIITKNI